MTTGRSWFSLLPPAFAAVPQYFDPYHSCSPSPSQNRTSGFPIHPAPRLSHSVGLRSTTRVQVFADTQRWPSNMQ